MKRTTPKWNVQQADLDTLEQFLLRSLQPVEPRREFRRGLHTRLAHPPVSPHQRLTIMQYVVISIAAASFVALAVVAAAHMLRALHLVWTYLWPGEAQPPACES